MFCGRCGSAVDNDAAFCNNCGAQLAQINGDKSVANKLLLQSLIGKIQAEIVFTGIKTIVFFACFLVYFFADESLLKALLYCGVFLWEVISGIKTIFSSFEFVERIKVSPVGIVSKYSCLKSEWSLTWFFFTRHIKKFVLDNKQSFIELENKNSN